MLQTETDVPSSAGAASGADNAPLTAVEYDSDRQKGFDDLVAGLRRCDMWMFLAMHDIRQRYRRSTLGPLWITIVLGTQVVGIGVLYSGLLSQDVSTFLPYLAAGLTVWALISGLLIDGSTMFITSAMSIRSVVAPISIHMFRTVAQHVIIFGHNLLLVVAADLYYQHNPGIGLLLFIPGTILCILNLSWFILLLGMASSRFRDIPLLVTSMIMLILIMTPILWRPEMLAGRSSVVVHLNPIFYLLEIVRGPLIGSPVPVETWIGVTVAAIIGWVIAALVYNRLHRRIPFWV